MTCTVFFQGFISYYCCLFFCFILPDGVAGLAAPRSLSTTIFIDITTTTKALGSTYIALAGYRPPYRDKRAAGAAMKKMTSAYGQYSLQCPLGSGFHSSFDFDMDCESFPLIFMYKVV